MWFLLSVVAEKHLHRDSYPQSCPLGFPVRDILADLMIVFFPHNSSLLPLLLFFCLIAASPAQPPCVWADHPRALMTSSCVEDKAFWVGSRSRLCTPKKKKNPNLGPFFSISGPQKTQFPLCNLACSTGQGAEHVGTLHVCMCPAFPVGTFAGIDPAVEVSVCSLAFYETLKPVTKKIWRYWFLECERSGIPWAHSFLISHCLVPALSVC